jgi:hypothetical protein
MVYHVGAAGRAEDCGAVDQEPTLMNHTIRRPTLAATLGAALLTLPPSPAGAGDERPAETRGNDIRALSQHFLDTKGNTAPWVFVPRESLKDVSTSEHPGMATLWPAGRGQDVRGLLERPIRIDEYPLPWEFHLGLVQNNIAVKGLSENQINYAVGLNLALTFSDPSTWPRDRTKLPPDTHSTQVFVVHLGNIGENYRPGVPQLRRTPLNFFDHSPEVFLLYGRGDLAKNLNGNWNMAYPWVGPDPSDSGTWSKHGGPADYVLRFRVSMLSPTVLQVGFGYGLHPGWKVRTVDVSRFGKITGVWEIGPVVSLDRWIPDVMAKELHLDEPPAWMESLKQRNTLLGKPPALNQALAEVAKAVTAVDAPDPSFQYYVDYAVFYGNGPKNVDHLSEDFDVPGFLADQKYYVEGNALCETFSNPGHLTVTQYGNNGAWAMCPILADSFIDFSVRKPPFEIELGVTPPDDAQPWNLWWNVGLHDEKGKFHYWQPGLQNVPGRGVRFFNVWSNDPLKAVRNPVVELEFEPELPQSILHHKPLHMLIQVADDTHLRVGFKARKGDPWVFSRAFDSSKAFGRIAKFAYPALVSFQGGLLGTRGWGAGNYPGYQKILIDYLHYRYGRSD